MNIKHSLLVLVVFLPILLIAQVDPIKKMMVRYDSIKKISFTYVYSAVDTPKTFKDVSFTNREIIYDKKGNYRRLSNIYNGWNYRYYSYKYDANDNLIFVALATVNGDEDYNIYRNFYTKGKLAKSIVKDSVLYDYSYNKPSIEDSIRIITYTYDSKGRIANIKCDPKRLKRKKLFEDIFGSSISIESFIMSQQQIFYSYNGSNRLREVKTLEYNNNKLNDTLLAGDDIFEYNLDGDTLFKFSLNSFDYFEYDSNKISAKYHYSISQGDTLEPLITTYSYKKVGKKLFMITQKETIPENSDGDKFRYHKLIAEYELW